MTNISCVCVAFSNFSITYFSVGRVLVYMLKIFDESVNVTYMIVTFSIDAFIRGGDVDAVVKIYTAKFCQPYTYYYRTRWIDNNCAVPRDSIFYKNLKRPYIYTVYNERTWPSLSGTVYIYI